MNPISTQSRFLHTIAAAALLAAAAPVGPVAAQDFQLHAEGAAAFWLDDPQSDRFTPGLYAAIRPGVSVGRVVSLQWSYAVLAVPPKDEFSDAGAAHFLTAGIRLRPLAPIQPDEKQLGGLFVDFNVGYVRTGPLDRLGIDTGIGYGFQPTTWLSVGPVLRYVQVLQPDRLTGADPNDAQLLTAGLDFGFGPAHKHEAEPVAEPITCPECAACPTAAEPPPEKECPVAQAATPAAVIAKTEVCPDGDKDGVCDADDRCPTEAGMAATLGCPIEPCQGKPLVVLVQFPFDSSSLPARKQNEPATMDPVLDAIAAAISQDPSCRVCIIGYTSEEGAGSYNQALSLRRATAVEKYLHARGLADNRLPTIGMGERCPLIPEASLVLNRRVEFRRLDEGQSCPTDCPAGQ